ncbi:MAG TPA: ATP-binding protein [Acetobacteraceae bacterium]|nr:ATP-binding protein [Acetobacteraceae bacterium]
MTPPSRESPRSGRRLLDRLSECLNDLVPLLPGDNTAGILVIDPAGHIVQADARLRAITGNAEGTLPGAPALTLFAEDGRATLQAMLFAAIQGSPLPDTLATWIGTDRHPVALAMFPVREDDGTISGALIRVTLEQSGPHAPTQRTQDRQLRMIGEFAAGVVHDLNNLTTAILGAVDSVLERPDLDAIIVGELQRIRLAGERAGALARHLLALGRRETAAPGAVAVNAAIRTLVPLLQSLVGKKIRFDLDLKGPDRLVRIVPMQLDQVLMNLTLNARDAMHAGGTLTLRSGDRALHRPELDGGEPIPAGKYVLIEVADTGSGIPPDVLPRIFEPFFTTRGATGGTGLGLSTVRGIASRAGGFVVVDSRVGGGTTVRLYLPPCDTIEQTEAVSVGQETTGLTQRRPGTDVFLGELVRRSGYVLLVEDEDQVRRLAQRALERAGWNVLSARSGEDALAMMPIPGSCRSADGLILLLSDIVLPGIDGPSLVSEVRQIWPGLPAILVSGYADSAVTSNLAATGVSLLAKPYSLWELRAAVERVTGGVPK